MTEPVLAELPFVGVSGKQCVEFMSAAGEVATNLFANGGKAITLEAGYYQQIKADGEQMSEAWTLGLNEAADEVLLRAVCDVDPSGGKPTSEINIFVSPSWALQNAGGHASTIQDILGPRFANIPENRAVDSVSLAFSSINAFYLLQKHISSLFGLVLARGGFKLGIVLQKGSAHTEKISRTQVETEVRPATETVRDKDGHIIYEMIVDEKGEPVFEIKRDKSGRPFRDEKTGEVIRHQKMEPKVMVVERKFEKLTTRVDQVQVTPIYLQIARVPQLGPKDFESALANESMYDPTWMMGDVLRGLHVKSRPFHRMDEETG